MSEPRWTSTADADDPGWYVVDFRTHSDLHGPDTFGGCMAYIADDEGCDVDDLSVHDKEALPHTVSGPEGNTGLSVQPFPDWIAS